MSEADTPTNGQELPKPNDFNVADSASADFSAAPTELPLQQSELLEEDWQTVNFPNAISIDAIAHPVPEVEEVSTAQPESSELTESLVSLSLPEVNEIVTIMQELQQRNGYLLNRVTQLEVVLNECQVTLEAQASRTQEQESILAQQSEELTSADEHIARLMHELECSHQAAQRQQILVETITAQLENSQERVAQLERECALTQQRYNEQTHALMQAENICRDLRSRLHRQQRYTLQFKAALEKCLDVSSPCHEAHPDLAAASATPNATKAPSATKTTAASDPAFLPKVDSIQPWSAQPWLMDADPEAAEAFSASESPLHGTPDTAFSDWSGLDSESVADSLLELPPSIAPIFQDLLASPTAEAAEAAEAEALNANHPLWNQAAIDSQDQLSISYNLKKKAEAAEAAEAAESTTVNPSPQAQEAIPAAEETEEPEFTEPTVLLESDPSHTLEAIAPSYALDWEEDLPEELVPALPEPTSSVTAPVEDVEGSIPPLTGADVNEEEELWHDLAKLIDISEAASGSARSQVETTAPSSDESEAIAASEESTSTGSFTFSSSWPSPTLHPLRSHKKRSSMAAVELPSFPQRRS
ncbi:MAG: hypothetical protein KME12_08595 [Trichocoleus desertorum ATA4-8-CV12]|jgi:hypothetical protein|nr:hypothetical protein [Trichocoleus desertorum ATA4-8-CV12]